MYTVLIDDDPISLNLAQLVLELEGLADTSTSFLSPTDALAFILAQLAAGRGPQVVLLDLNMPVVSGWDFLDQLHRHQLLQDQCVVYLLTSSIAYSDKERAKDYPLVKQLLHKPLTEAKLQLIHDDIRPVPPTGESSTMQPDHYTGAGGTV
jgi:CheY-like chemotaxis protein